MPCSRYLNYNSNVNTGVNSSGQGQGGRAVTWHAEQSGVVYPNRNDAVASVCNKVSGYITSKKY